MIEAGLWVGVLWGLIWGGGGGGGVECEGRAGSGRWGWWGRGTVLVQAPVSTILFDDGHRVVGRCAVVVVVEAYVMEGGGVGGDVRGGEGVGNGEEGGTVVVQARVSTILFDEGGTAVGRCAVVWNGVGGSAV